MFTVLAILFPILALIIGVAVFVATVSYVKSILVAQKDSSIVKS